MSEFISSQDSLWPRLKALTHESQDRLWMAVAYWGQGADVRLDLKRAPRSFRLVCDLYSGGCNPATIRAIRKLRPKGVRYLNGLHAKVYLGDRAAIVGSANASAAGTGWEGSEAKSLREAAVKVEDSNTLHTIAKWMKDLWSGGKEIKERDLKAAEEIWRRRRATRPAAVVGQRGNQRTNAIDRGILVAWENLERRTKEEKAAFSTWKIQANAGSNWDFFSDDETDWIPAGAKLLFVDTGAQSYLSGVRASFDCVEDRDDIFPMENGRYVIPVRKKSTIDLGGEEFQLTPAIRQQVWKYVRDLVARKPRKKSGVFPLSEILRG